MPGRNIIVAAGLALVVLGLGALDYLTGPHITFTALYIGPVLIGSWLSGRRAGWVLALLAGAANMVADLLIPGRPFDDLLIPTWNAGSRLAVFLIGAEAFARIRRNIAEIRTLQGLLPICAWCKRIRDEGDQGAWKDVERYVAEHSTAEFTHGICPDCAQRVGSS